MTPPLTPAARALVAAGRRALEPGAAELARVRQQLLAAISPAPSASASGGNAAVPSAGSAAGLKAVLVLVGAAAVIGGGALAWRAAHRADRARPRATVAATVTPSPAPAAPPRQTPSPQPAVTPPRPAVTPLPAPAPPAQPAPRAHVRAPRHAAPAPPSSMAVELAAIQRARAALRAQHPADALAALDPIAHLAAPRLAPEAAFVRIQAHCALGHAARARALAGAFAARWPDSPLAARAARLCGGAP